MVQQQARAPLKHAAVLNSMRWALYHRLQDMGLPIEVGTGGRTKFNRVRLDLPKVHWIDAACVGPSGEQVSISLKLRPLSIRATGHGSRQMCRVDRYGFARTSAKCARRVRGFRTGDSVRARVLTGTKAGCYVGRVAIRASGYFDIATADGVVKSIAWRWFRLVQRADGYAYAPGAPAAIAP